MTLLCAAALIAVVPLGCGPDKEVRQAPPKPRPAYTGPEFLRTSIASMTTIRGYRPRYVSGYGLVVGLNGTGSPDCPPALRAWLLNEMAARGVGRESAGGGLGNISPSQLLASETTAVVIVEGVIPPGGVRGSKFDISIAALPQTQTTSLEGGRLYTTDLRQGGAIIGAPASKPYAEAHGDVFVNPFFTADRAEASQRVDDPRIGRILGGGIVLDAEIIALELNQPSYARSRMIADRSNGRFPQAPADKFPMAVAKTDQLIQINVLNRFANDPRRMLDMISGLFLNPTEQFARAKALEMLEAVENNPRYGTQVALAWQAMGKRIVPLLRDHYNHDNKAVAMTALQAGAYLGDLDALEPLDAIASSNTTLADRAAFLIGLLANTHPQDYGVGVALRNLIDHDDALVRFAAFDALSQINDPSVKQRWFDDRLELAMVRSSKPMIYVTRTGGPRVVIFDQVLGFKRPMLFSHNDNQLMLRLDGEDPMLAVYYKKPGQSRAYQTRIAPAVGNLVYLMANRPTEGDPSLGFEMSYSQIVRVLFEMSQAGWIDAPLVLQPTDLEQRLATQRRGPSDPGDDGQRPEGGPDDGSGPRFVPRPVSSDN